MLNAHTMQTMQMMQQNDARALISLQLDALCCRVSLLVATARDDDGSSTHYCSNDNDDDTGDTNTCKHSLQHTETPNRSTHSINRICSHTRKALHFVRQTHTRIGSTGRRFH
jgi:hypothetical protein